jgi:hypothetical protein
MAFRETVETGVVRRVVRRQYVMRTAYKVLTYLVAAEVAIRLRPGVVGWLGLPLYALLLTARVFGRPESPPRPADPDHVTGAVRP